MAAASRRLGSTCALRDLPKPRRRGGSMIHIRQFTFDFTCATSVLVLVRVGVGAGRGNDLPVIPRLSLARGF